MLELARVIDPSEITGSRIQEVADQLAAEFDNSSIQMFDKTGVIPEPAMQAVFDAMQKASLEGRYKDPDGRQRLFYVMSLRDADLLNFSTPEATQARQARLVKFASAIPDFADRAWVESEFGGMKYRLAVRKLLDKLPDIDTDEEMVREVLKHRVNVDPNDEGNDFSWFYLHEALIFLGNPSLFADKRTSDEASPNDYPILIPVINVSLSPDLMPADPLAALREFNRKKYRGEQISKEEQDFADKCSRIVRIFEKMAYVSPYGGAATKSLLALPLFPYQMFEENPSQDYGEPWMARGLNSYAYWSMFEKCPVVKV